MQPINDIFNDAYMAQKCQFFSRIVRTRTFLPVIFLKILQIDIFGPNSCKIDNTIILWIQ